MKRFLLAVINLATNNLTILINISRPPSVAFFTALFTSQVENMVVTLITGKVFTVKPQLIPTISLSPHRHTLSGDTVVTVITTY